MPWVEVKDAVVEFVRMNQAWAPFVVGALAFCESLAVLSLFVPATVILLGVGALIAVAGLEFWQLWLGAALGATLGDWVSYALGRYLKHDAFRLWPFSRYPAMIDRGQRFFDRWGAWSLFVGRFFGPARAVVPLIAGVFAVPRVLFWAANTSSASVWAFVMLSPGAGLAGMMR